MKPLLGSVAILVGLALTAPAQASDWEKYKAEGYGFSMDVPKGTKIQEESWGDWAGLHAKTADGVELWAVTKLCYQAKDKEFSDFGVELTGIPAEHWKQVDKGKKTHGWHWYKVYLATHGDQAVFGGYGIGPRGSYLMVLKTTLSDYQAHKGDYQRFYDSIRLEDDWRFYHAKDYKFSMLIPKDAKVEEFHDEELGDGLHAKHGDAELWGLAELGKQYKSADIEKLRDALTEIPAAHWKEVDQGKNSHGFSWYKTVRAAGEGQVVFALYGTSSKGSFLLVLKTSDKELKADRRDYELWYRSIRGD